MSTKNGLRVSAAVLGVFIGLAGCLMDKAGDGTEATQAEDVALSPPTGLTVTVVSTTAMSLAWSASAGATKYVVLLGLSPGTETTFTSVPASPTTFSYNHLSPNTEYCWEVANLNATNEVSAPSNEVCASTADAPVPPTPTNVTATANSSSRITVTWTAVPGATAYFVDMAQAPGTPTLLATVRAPATSFVAAGLSPSTTYAFDVRAQTAAGTSAPSTPEAFATTFVLGLEAYWKLDEDSGTVAVDSSGFNRNGTLAGGAAFSNDKPNVLDNKSTVHVPATDGKITVSNVPAFNFVGTPFSVLMWVKVPAAASAVHIIGSRTAGCGAVAWEIAQDATSLNFTASSNVSSFGSSLVVGDWTHVAVTYDGTTLVHYMNGVQTASRSFTVPNHARLPLDLGHVADCTGGEVLVDETQIYSRALSSAEVAALGTLPDPPVNLTATVVSSTAETLAWTAVPNAAKYFIYRGTEPGNETFFTSSPAASSTFANGHLTPSTQYSWQVAVVRGTLFSNPSNEVLATTLAGPTAPTGVTATALSASRIRVDWTAVAGAVHYFVFESVNNGPFNFKSTTTTPTFTAANLITKTLYSYEVIAIDSGNTSSPASAPASATTL